MIMIINIIIIEMQNELMDATTELIAEQLIHQNEVSFITVCST